MARGWLRARTIEREKERKREIEVFPLLLLTDVRRSWIRLVIYDGITGSKCFLHFS